MSGSRKRKGDVAEKKKKKNDADEESSNHHVVDDLTLTTIFPTVRIKQMLYRDPKVARIEAGGLELINTTSALFLQTILNQIPKLSANSKNNGCRVQQQQQQQNVLVTLQDIQNVIQQDPTLSFLQSTINKEADTSLRPYTPAKKRAAAKTKKPAAVASKTESVQEAMSIAAKTSMANPTTTITSQEIVQDEDDYD
jgi:hypothetical protein